MKAKHPAKVMPIKEMLTNNNQSVNQSINNVYSNFKTQEINLQLQKVSKLQSKILAEKSVIKHL